MFLPYLAYVESTCGVGRNPHVLNARVCLALLFLACRGSIFRTEQTRDVALGWSGEVRSIASMCAPVSPHPTKVIASSAGDYEAIAVGSEDFACGADVVHIRVSAPARIAIEFPTTIVLWEQHPLIVVGYDAAGRKLDVGRRYARTLYGVLVYAPCSDMDMLCGLGAEMLRAERPGRGSVTATFAGLSSTLDVLAVAPVDAGPG